jgi:hypothetical protein
VTVDTDTSFVRDMGYVDDMMTILNPSLTLLRKNVASLQVELHCPAPRHEDFAPKRADKSDGDNGCDDAQYPDQHPT